MTREMIAVVSRDEALVEQLRDVFKTTGYTVNHLNHSGDVVATLQSDPPGLIAIELVDPEYLSSVELATILKLNKRTRALPIVLISSDANRLRVYTEQLRQRSAPKLWTLPQPFDSVEALRVFVQALGPSALLVREAS